MSTSQEYWDACLIRAWRNHGTYLDAVVMFKSITGIDLMTEGGHRAVLRTPRRFFPAKTSMRIFVAQFLPKISDRLFDQLPEKDVLLLRKLATSTYDSEDRAYTTAADHEHTTEQGRVRKNRLRMGRGTQLVTSRNSATDWNVTKGKAKVRVRK
jgi:hypothetical protein